MLIQLLEHPHADIVAVVSRSGSTFNSDFCSLAPLAESHGIPCFLADGQSQDAMAAWLTPYAPDVIFCLGWSHLLSQKILGLPSTAAIGYHPAPLPRGRGRHPVIWALVLGLKKAASCFFLMDDGADTGDIISQAPVIIAPDDDAKSLLAKLTTVATAQLNGIVDNLHRGQLPRRPQDHKQSSSWRRRGQADGQIDWRMSAQAIDNLVRALVRPYPGADLKWNGATVKVWKSKPVPATGLESAEPGKVLRVEDGRITVKCGDSAICLIDHEFLTLPDTGAYL